MKKVILSAIVFVVTLQATAQENKDVKTEVKTVITTVKDSEGERKIVRTQETKLIQPVVVGEPKEGTKNIPQVASPISETKTTKVIENGDLKSIKVDRSAYYMSNGVKYQIKSDKEDYSIIYPTKKKNAKLKKTSNGNYIFVNEDRISIGYFDNNGNLILESYDAKTDKIVVEKFDIVNE